MTDETPDAWKKMMVIDCTLPLDQEAQAKARVRRLKEEGLKASKKKEIIESTGEERIVVRKEFRKPPPPSDRDRKKGIGTLVF